jgi:3-oxoacyl-[acyl-carrier-protein] synthase II
LSLFQQRALAAARQCLAPELLAAAPAARMGVAIGTGLGALNDTAAFVENMILNDERAPRPLLFSNSVHNSLAGQLAAEYGFQGLNLTSVQRGVCFESALAEALREVASGRAPAFLAGAADELNPYHLAAGRRWGWWSENTPPCRPLNGVASAGRPPQGEGCALFALAGPDLASQCPPLAWVAACRTGRIEGPPDAVAEALWIQDALLTAGVAPDGLDMLLTGASGWETEDRFYGSVGAALSRLAGRPIPCGAYKQACGDFPAASAFGFLAAIGLVSGRVAPASCLPVGALAPERCQLAALYTVCGRSKALCLVCA